MLKRWIILITLVLCWAFHNALIEQIILRSVQAGLGEHWSTEIENVTLHLDHLEIKKLECKDLSNERGSGNSVYLPQVLLFWGWDSQHKAVDIEAFVHDGQICLASQELLTPEPIASGWSNWLHRQLSRWVNLKIKIADTELDLGWANEQNLVGNDHSFILNGSWDIQTDISEEINLIAKYQDRSELSLTLSSRPDQLVAHLSSTQFPLPLLSHKIGCVVDAESLQENYLDFSIQLLDIKGQQKCDVEVQLNTPITFIRNFKPFFLERANFCLDHSKYEPESTTYPPKSLKEHVVQLVSQLNLSQCQIEGTLYGQYVEGVKEIKKEPFILSVSKQEKAAIRVSLDMAKDMSIEASWYLEQNVLFNSLLKERVLWDAIQLEIRNKEKRPIANFRMDHQSPQLNTIDFTINKLSARELQLVNMLTAAAGLVPIEVGKGVLQGSGKLRIADRIEIENLTCNLQDVESMIGNSQLRIPKLECTIDANRKFELNIDHAECICKRIDDLNQEVKKINCALLIDSEDMQQRAEISCIFSGIANGSFDLSFPNSSKPKVNVKGTVKLEELAQVLSLAIPVDLKDLKNHEIQTSFKIDSLDEHKIRWEGSVILDVIHELLPELRSKGIFNVITTVPKAGSINAIDIFMPQRTVLSQFFQALCHITESQLEGTLEFSELSVRDWLSPVLFPNKDTVLSGLANARVELQPGRLLVSYNVSDFVLENEYCRCEIDKLEQLPSFDHSLTTWLKEPLYAMHCIDFHNNDNFGSANVSKGKYLDKQSGLEFLDVQGQVFLHGKTLSIIDLTTTCEGLAFHVDLDWDYRDPRKGVFELAVNAQSIAGSIQDVQKLCGHFAQDDLLEIKAEGTVSSLGHRAQMSLFGKEAGMDIFLSVEGNLKGITVHNALSKCSIEGWDGSFKYTLPNNQLEIANINGNLNLALENPLGISIHESWIRAAFGDKRFFSFSVVGEELGYTLFKFQGKAVEDSNNIEKIKLLLEPHASNLLGLPLEEGFIVIGKTPESSYNRIKGMFDINDLREVLRKDLKFLKALIGNTGSFLDTVLQKNTLSGSLRYCFQSKGNSNTWKCKFDSTNLKWNQRVIDPFGFSIRSIENGIKADALIKSFVFNGIIHSQSNILSIDPLNIRSPLMGNIFAKVQIHPEQQLANFEIKETKIALDGLRGILDGPFRKDKNSFWEELKGELNLSGHFELNLAKKDTVSELQGEIQLEGRKLACKKVLLGSVSGRTGIRLGLSKIQLQKGNFSLYPQIDPEHISDIPVQFSYAQALMENGNGQLDKGAFNMSGSLVPWAFKSFTAIVNFDDLPNGKSVFKDEYFQYINPSVDLNGEAEVKITNKGELEAQVDVIHPSLRIDTKIIDLDRAQLEITNNRFEVRACYVIGNVPVWLHWHPKEDLSSLETIWVTDTTSEDQRILSVDNATCIVFNSVGNAPLDIMAVQGKFRGVQFSLRREAIPLLDKGMCLLGGSIHGDFSIISDLLVNEGYRPLKWLQFGKGWFLNGQWKLFLQDLQKTEFLGEIVAEDFELCGLELQYLKAQVLANYSRLSILNLDLSDPAGHIEIDKFLLLRGDNSEYWVDMPEMKSDWIRPSSLRVLKQQGKTFNFGKDFQLKELYIEDLKGNLKNSTSLSCIGRVDFSTVKETPWTILNIPGDLWARLGFSTSVLVPVSGRVHFELLKGKVFLRSLTDSYSIGKRSKFYLDPTDRSSYIGLNGDLFIQLRMKQQNLILKLMDLLTLVIEGTIEKPVYSLQRTPIITPKDPSTSKL